MKVSCDDLVNFADGELEPDDAEAFRSHLQTCAACRAGLLEAMQLSARLGAFTPAEDVNPAVAIDAHVASSAEALATPILPRKPPATKLRRNLQWSGGAVAAAAAITLFAYQGGRLGHRGSEPVPLDAFAAIETRPHATRTALPAAASYRRVRDQMRGATGASGDHISHDSLAALEKRPDKYELAIANAWNGDLKEAAEQLRSLAPTPSIRSDLAAVEIVARSNDRASRQDPTTRNDNVEAVLTELESLTPGDGLPARAARWNQAILLSHLELPLGAARAFRAIGNENEPQWADEARLLGEEQHKQGHDLWDTWQRAKDAGEALVNQGASVPTDLLRRVPGLMRAYLYRAVRTATTPERVLALAGMAGELDQLAGQTTLGNYVQRVAKLDFRRRAPLADAYARLLRGERPTPAIMARLTTPTATADVVDIVIGAMVELDVVDHLAAFQRMATQTGDPWFAIVQARQEAAAAVRRADWLGAEARLQKAQKLCTASPEVTYQCLELALELGRLYQELHRVPEARDVLYAAIDAARGAGEWVKYVALLARLADVERFNSSTATARAYANEVLLNAGLRKLDHCEEAERMAYNTLTGAALLDLDGRAARQYFDAALRCGEPDLVAANYLADIARLDPQPGDLERLQGWLGKLRASGRLTPADHVLADEIEARLLVEHDRAAGTALLQRAIAAAATLRGSVAAEAEKARAGAYSVLAFDAARRGDHAQVLALIAQELGLERPAACAVAMVAEDERAVVVVRSADGQDRAAYDNARRPRASALTVSAQLAQGLQGCAHVQVMAHAALQGQPRVLPDALPWSYATGAHKDTMPVHPGPTGRETLIVANVTPPPSLHLPALLPRPVDPAHASRTLSGAAATPARVLAAMRDADEIEFHTHALVDLGVSDASYLVLSPEIDGRYALTAEAIRGAELRGRPIIVLAACASALGARYQHAAWSLPHAFLAVGARAVLAAGTAIPDREAGPFFAGVMERVRAGADAAAALRDQRMATLASSPSSSWVANVILFE